MSATELAPRGTYRGIVVVWVAALFAALAIGIFVAPDARAAWMPVGLGACFFLSFAIQLSYARSHGFIFRIGASVLGAFMVMGLVGVGFGLSTLVGI